jgi:hypothetical protein
MELDPLEKKTGGFFMAEVFKAIERDEKQGDVNAVFDPFIHG